MSSLYKAVCARLLQVDCTERINLCCLCLETVGESGACVDDEVVLDIHRGHSLKLAKILKILLDECFSEVMFLLKSVCKQCISSAIAGYRFIQRCKANTKKLTKVIDDLEESLYELLPTNKINCKSIYVAIQAVNNSTSTTTMKRYYDIRRQFVPQDTAFLRFTQIVESQKKSPDVSQDEVKKGHKQTKNINEIDQTLQALMCCRKVTDTNELLDNPDKLNEFKCKVCKELFAKSTSLRVHFFRVHRQKEFKCVKCKTAEDTHAKVGKHKQLYPDQKKLMSLLNNDLLESNNTEELNIQLVDEDNNHQFDEETHSENEVQNKKFIRAVPTNLLLQDESCRKVGSKSFDTEAQYIVEGKTVTDNCCNNCGMKFSTRARYLTHKKKFKNNDCRRCKGRGEFKCDLCNYTAFYKHLVRRHIRFEHFGIKGHVCSYCNKNCYSKLELEMHLRKHTGEQPFKCLECGVKFTSKNGLKHHMYIHTGERPYKCEFCEKAFRTGSSRREHIANVHNPPSLKCKICGHMYKNKKDLNRHVIKHYATQPLKKIRM